MRSIIVMWAMTTISPTSDVITLTQMTQTSCNIFTDAKLIRYVVISLSQLYSILLFLPGLDNGA